MSTVIGHKGKKQVESLKIKFNNKDYLSIIITLFLFILPFFKPKISIFVTTKAIELGFHIINETMAEKFLQHNSEIKTRVKVFLKSNKIKQVDFARLIGINDSQLRRKEYDFSSGTIIKILTAYGELNPDWLLLGKGDMLRGISKDAEQLEISKDRIIAQKDEIISQLNLIVESQAELLKRQRERIRKGE